MKGKIIGALVGFLIIHSGWAFVAWEFWPWVDLANWSGGERFGLLYAIFASAIIGGMLGNLFVYLASKKET